MSKPKTRYVIILDKSGSMSQTKKSAIVGFNEKIQQIKLDAQEQDILCSLITFNGNVFEHFWDVDASKLSEATEENYAPAGGTAMRDAIGYAIQKLLETSDPNDKETAYLIDIITDGQTLDDKIYSWEALREMISQCEATKRWTFTYTGCEKQYLESLSRNTGTKVANMASWVNTNQQQTELGFTNMRNRQAKYFKERSVGQMASCLYASDNAECVADYSQTEVTSEAAPVVVAAVDLPDIEFKDVLQKQPKYTNISISAGNGNDVFSNCSRVQWENSSGVSKFKN